MNTITQFSKLILLTLMMPLLSTLGTNFLIHATSDLDTLIGFTLWIVFGIDVYFLLKIRKALLQSLARRDRRF